LQRLFLLLFLMQKHGLTKPLAAQVDCARMFSQIVQKIVVIPMALNSQDIDRIANLARLELQPEESQRMLGQINGFFDIVEQMRAVDTTGIEPLAHPVAVIQDIALRLRADVASEPNEREANQRSAPAVERGLFLVPKVIE
jgi:aspartyl-tRNA(Asn)/glutamyl-tRNA(Gln) amidotransferase subunit C